MVTLQGGSQARLRAPHAPSPTALALPPEAKLESAHPVGKRKPCPQLASAGLNRPLLRFQLTLSFWPAHHLAVLTRAPPEEPAQAFDTAWPPILEPPPWAPSPSGGPCQVCTVPAQAPTALLPAPPGPLPLTWTWVGAALHSLMCTSCHTCARPPATLRKRPSPPAPSEEGARGMSWDKPRAEQNGGGASCFALHERVCLS